MTAKHAVFIDGKQPARCEFIPVWFAIHDAPMVGWMLGFMRSFSSKDECESAIKNDAMEWSGLGTWKCVTHQQLPSGLAPFSALPQLRSSKIGSSDTPREWTYIAPETNAA